MADFSGNKKQDFILLKIAGYDAKKQTIYGVNIDTGKTISIIKSHSQKQPFIKNLATESDRRYAPTGSTVAIYGVTPNPSYPDTYRAEWATTITKNQTEEIVVTTPTTVSPVINLPNGKTQVKIRILDESPIHIDSVEQIAERAKIAVEFPTEISGVRGCIVRTGLLGSDEAYMDNIRLDHTKDIATQISNHVRSDSFETFKRVANENKQQHAGYIEVVGYTDAINANYNDPKNDAKRAKTPNFQNDGVNGGPTFSYAAVVYNKQYKNITQVVPLPALKQIKSVVGLVGSHSKVEASTLPYIVPKNISDVKPTNIYIPPQYTETKPMDVRKKTNKQGQFTSVQVTIDPKRIAEFEHRLQGISSVEPFIVQSKKEDPNVFKGFYYKKDYLEHISSILSDVADTPAIYTKDKNEKVFVLGRTDQEPFASKLTALIESENGTVEKNSAFSFPIERKANVLSELGELLEVRASIPPTVIVVPKVVEENVQHSSTANVSFKDWHSKRYGNSSQGIGNDLEREISAEAEKLGINWSETKHNIDWPQLGEKTSHGKNNAIPYDIKHTVYVNIAYDHAPGYDTPGLSINLQNMDTHRNDSVTLQLTKDTYAIYEQMVKNDNYIPKVSETPEQIAARKEEIKQRNLIKFAEVNAEKAAYRKLAFKASLNLEPLTSHKALEEKKIPEAIELLGLKESFNYKYPGIKAALYEVYDIHGSFAGFQEIFEEKVIIAIDRKTGEKKIGNKLFNTGLSKKTAEGIAIGTHRVVGEINNEPHVILYAESYANAISNTLATGQPSVICLDVANIKNVIGLMQKKYPNHIHIQVADNDIASIKKGNIGMLSALDNAYNYGVSYIKPDLANIDSTEKLSDTSDIYVHKGKEALAQDLKNITEGPQDEFSYHAERFLYVSDKALERQLVLTMKALEGADGRLEDNEIREIATQLFNSRNAIYDDSEGFESSIKIQDLSDTFISSLRKRYRTTSAPTYDEVIIPPKVVQEAQSSKKPQTIVEKSTHEQQNNQVSPYPVSVTVASDARHNGKFVTHITSPSGMYNEGIIELLRANDIPFLRNPDGESFTADVKYSNLINSALSTLTGAPELYSTRIKNNETGTSSVVVRGNFGNNEIQKKMEVVSGKKYNNKHKGFIFDSVNDYIFVKEALKHHFTAPNPSIEEIESVNFSAENTDLRAGIYKIADIFNKPSSSIAQSHVYMRIHNPRLASFQSPLLAALYGETRDAVKAMDNFSQLDPNRKLDAVMHQLKREIQNFIGSHPDLADKYSQHLSGALAIIESQQDVSLSPELFISTDKKETITQDVVEAVESETDTVEAVESETDTVEAVESETDTVEAVESETDTVEAVESETDTVDAAESEEQALQQRIANYIEVPSESTQLVLEEAEAADEFAAQRNAATVDVAISPQEEILSELIENEEKPESSSNLDTELENRLSQLYENTKTYIQAKFDVAEFEESLKEPGSSHYDIGKGFNSSQFLDDIKQIPQSALAHKFGKLEYLTPSYLFISVKNELINERIEWMKTIFNEALKTNPNYNPYGIASKFAQRNVYGLVNPYVDGFDNEASMAEGNKSAAYDKEMLADDLLTIEGQKDITTAAGYFKVIQAKYHRQNGFELEEEEVDYKLGVEMAEYIRYVSPVQVDDIEYLIIDDFTDAERNTHVLMSEDEELKPITDYRVDVLTRKEFTENRGFIEARSVSIGRERIFQATQFDFTNNTKKVANLSISPDVIALANRWVKITPFEIVNEISQEPEVDVETIDNASNVEIAETQDDIGVDNSSEAQEVLNVEPNASLADTRTTSEVFESLFIDAINAGLSYGDFYSEVFKDTGTLFNSNPYVVDGVLDKIGVKNALQATGFKSPKSMFDSLALRSMDSLNTEASSALRDTGLITEYNPEFKLSETYTKIDELLQESGIIGLEQAKEIISGSALSWVSNPKSTILVHDILREDLDNVSAKFLQENYSEDAIKLLLDFNSVQGNEFNSLNILLTQHKSLKNLERIGIAGFLELDLETQEEIAKEIGVTKIVGSPKDIAYAAFTRINDVKDLSALRNSQYSFIKAAITIEKSGGKIPNSAIRQMNRLLNNETLYRPVILETIKLIEQQKIDLLTDASYAHLDNVDTKSIEIAINRSNKVNELILRTPSAKRSLAEGSEERALLDFNTFNYQYFTGNNDPKNLDISPAYYLKESEDLIRTVEPIVFEELLDLGLYPANGRSYSAMFSDTEEFAKHGASILTGPDSGIATIHLSGQKYLVSILDETKENKPVVLSEHDEYESATTFLYNNAETRHFTFNNMAKESLSEIVLDKLGVNATILEYIKSTLSNNDEQAIVLATLIKESAEQHKLAINETDDALLDALDILERSYNYARIHAIADFVDLSGIDTSPELAFLEYVAKNVVVDVLPQENESELDRALEVLKRDLSDEDLLDVQSATIIDENLELLTTEEAAEIEKLVSALEERFEEPTNKVGEFVEDNIELIVDNHTDKSLEQIAQEALSLEQEVLKVNNITEGDIIIGRIDKRVTFGYVANIDNELRLSPYRYQDIDLAAMPQESIVRNFAQNGIITDLPLFGLTREEIERELNKTNGAEFFPSPDDIAIYIEGNSSQPIRIEQSVINILEKVAIDAGMSIDEFKNAFRVLSTLPDEPLLITSEESKFITQITGNDGYVSAKNWLADKRVIIRNSLINHLFETGLQAEVEYFDIESITSNQYNHQDLTRISDINNVHSIDAIEIRALLSGNVTLNKLISDINEETELEALFTELVLEPNSKSLVVEMNENGAINTDGIVIKNGQWLDLPQDIETLPAPLSLEQVSVSTKGEKQYSRGDEALYITNNQELDLGLIFKDVYEIDTHVILTDLNGRSVGPIERNQISTDIDKITVLADTELDTLTKDQVLIISEPLTIETLMGPRSLSGNELLALHLATNKFNNEIRKDIDLLSVPDGYEVILDNNEFSLSMSENLGFIDSIGKHQTMSDLRKAILVAKRSNIFKEVTDNENKRAESERSTLVTTPDPVLSDIATNVDTKAGTGEIPKGKTTRSGGILIPDHGSDKIIEDQNRSTIIPGELDESIFGRTRSSDSSEGAIISTNGGSVRVESAPNVNFIFDDELIAELTSPKTIAQIYEVNIEAIKLAKTLTSEQREATHEEKKTLAKYRGWGGAKPLFGESYAHADRRTELSEWLTPEEYESARRSVLSAFYTSPVIAKATWSILTRLGVKGGLGLEPSFGTGNFASTIPPELQGSSTLQARELDSLTGEIAAHIHGNFVQTIGFEKTNFPSNYFDFSIGNIPFGDYKVYDRNHKNMSSNLIHDYFILKMLDKVKPGGFVPVLTSSGTMDKKSNNVRKEISKTADLIGAIRLPNSAFKDNSGTEALIDILVFQKRDPKSDPQDTDWLEVSEVDLKLAYTSNQERTLPVNNYFIQNPQMVLGNLIAKSSRFGFEVGVMSEEEMQYQKAPDIGPLLQEVVEKFPENIHFDYVSEVVSYKRQETDFRPIKENADGKIGSYVINSNGDIAQIQLEVEFNEQTLEADEKTVSVQLQIPEKAKSRLSALIRLKESTFEHLSLMASKDSSDDEIAASMSELNNQYDEVVKKYNFLNAKSNKSIFKEDPDAGVLLSLEHYDRQAKVATKADLFKERTVFPNKIFENIENSQEAVLISLSEHGKIIPEYVSELTGKSWDSITNELSGSVFHNPETGGWEPENAYLSGNVREKLTAAQAALSVDEKYQLNVDHLLNVIPEQIPYFEIRAKLGSDWIPPTDIQDFIKYIFKDTDEVATPSERSDFKVIKINGQWQVDISKTLISRYEGNTKNAYGTNEWDAGRLIVAALNNTPVKVTYTDDEGKKFTNPTATAEAQGKFNQLKEEFKTWLWRSESRAIRLENLYNNLRNSYVEPKFDGSQIQFNGLSPYLAGKNFTPRENQCNAVMRYLTTGKCLFIHDVGVGKSFTLLASIMKGHEVGRHTKPILTVPKSVFPQMQALALTHFPNAKILMLDTVKIKDPKEKAIVINKIAMNNWDIVILPHTVLPKLDVPLDFKLKLVEEELGQVMQTIKTSEQEGYSSISMLTRAQSTLEKERAKLERAMDENETYDALNIEELGIDAIFVDEADEFVNLKKITSLGSIKGVGSAQSARASALHRITEYLHREVEDAGVVLATGTDIRNNMADLYTLMRFTDPSLLEANKVIHFDDFVGSFGDIQTQFEIAPEGSGYLEVTRLNKFINIPELLMMYRQVADVVTAEQAGVQRPNIDEIHVKGEQCQYLEAYMGVLAERAERSRNGNPVFDNDNLLAISSGGRKSSLSMNLVDERIPFNMNSKVAQCIENTAKVYSDNLAMSPSQIIFSDLGVPNKDGRFDLYNQIKSKLIEKGIPGDKIVFARDFNTDIRKQDLQDRMNSGDIAVCIGSTENMGVGKNVQKRLAAIHDLSIPWRYRDMVQRLGRIERFGNTFKDAKRYIYITEDSFDLFILQKIMQKAQITLQAKLSPRDSVREFVDDVEPKHSDIMALGTSNPIIQEALEVESEVIKLEIEEKAFHKSLVNIRSRKSKALNVIEYAKTRVENLTGLIEAVKGKPCLFGDRKVESEADITKISNALNKAIKSSIESEGQRSFKVGSIGDANIVIDAKFNGNFQASIERNGFKEEIAFAAYLKTVTNELTKNTTPILQGKLEHAISTIADYEVRMDSLNAQSTSTTFLKANELQELRLKHKDLEVKKASLLNELVEIENPLEKFKRLIDELPHSTNGDIAHDQTNQEALLDDFTLQIEAIS